MSKLIWVDRRFDQLRTGDVFRLGSEPAKEYIVERVYPPEDEEMIGVTAVHTNGGGMFVENDDLKVEVRELV